MNHLDLIQLRFPNRLRLTLAEACLIIGMPVGTARNRLSQKTFEIQTVKDGSRVYVPVQTLAEYLDKQTCSKPNKKVGRPLKASKFQANNGVA
jgi:hypothetical protein